MGTITKALEILSYFSSSTPALGLSEVVRRSGRDKATVHRHLVELQENGFLEQHPETRAYRLGPAILRLAAVREATMPVRSVVRPIVEALSRDVGELVHFSLLQGKVLSAVCHADPGHHGTQVHFDTSEVLPLHATSSGLAVLAFGPQSLRDEVLKAPLAPHAKGTITDPQDLLKALEDVRARGYGVSDQTFDDEVASLAVAVYGPEGHVTGALAIAVPMARMTPEKRKAAFAALRIGVQQVCAAIGGTIPQQITNAWASETPTSTS
ncbi:IclR family transcriptional regulator [Primorskyibacter sp. 2E233]|uniref:IclR family transcriptional regulator n=1 Tax=Primorskyibacter sp. 2E233 TaxID=3413431 RepID=UPI003BF0B78C